MVSEDMKAFKKIVIGIFLMVLTIPLVFFNFKEDVVSVIDNKKLKAYPWKADKLTKMNIESFINDRIGMRDEAILAFTVLNDYLFDKMVHPSYTYGRNGYVFGAGLTVNNPYSKFHEEFSIMVKKIETYCEERNVPFVFVFNPAKPAIYTQYLPVGRRYDREWVEKFICSLKTKGVNYIDNTVLLRNKWAGGEVVFNKKYDANHWNDLGAFYGTNEMLRNLQLALPQIHLTDATEIENKQVLKETLPVSKFPIHEFVPQVIIKEAKYHTEKSKDFRKEIELHSRFKGFNYYTNSERLAECAPKALVFQGSYMNGFGYKYLANGFGEYIHVHDYQNVINFPYYFNIFQPDCVIFEVAEYTFSDGYFSYKEMKKMNLNPPLNKVLVKKPKHDMIEKSLKDITVKSGKVLTKINWKSKDVAKYCWLEMDNVYDMRKNKEGYEVTVLTESYKKEANKLRIFTMNNDGSFTKYY